mgnify:CR=1 FL=1
MKLSKSSHHERRSQLLCLTLAVGRSKRAADGTWTHASIDTSGVKGPLKVAIEAAADGSRLRAIGAPLLPSRPEELVLAPEGISGSTGAGNAHVSRSRTESRASHRLPLSAIVRLWGTRMLAAGTPEGESFLRTELVVSAPLSVNDLL